MECNLEYINNILIENRKSANIKNLSPKTRTVNPYNKKKC